MGWIYRQPKSDNWFAKFKGPDGRWKRVTTGTSDRAMAKKVMIELERIALSDDYFIARKLYPNVDFYTGLIYRSMAFPTDFFTVLFAVARVSGWMAQWEEMILDKEQKIARPRQIYVGEGERQYTDQLNDKFPRARKDSIRK